MPTANPLEYNFSFKRGDSWPPFSFKLKNESGVDVSFSGASILMKVKKRKTDTVALQTLTHLSGWLIANEIATIDSAHVQNTLPVGRYVHDIQVTLSTGITKTVYEGEVEITQDVS